MRYGKYEFVCRFQGKAHLPPFKGATVRGLLGHALKQVVCALKRQACSECLLRRQCLYALLFETGQALTPPPGAFGTSPPPPFVIEPPLTGRTDYAAGDEFAFRLLLFGRANDQLPYFVYALDRMGRTGLGRRVNGHRGRFTLERIDWNALPIYQKPDDVLDAPDHLPALSVNGRGASGGASNMRLTLNLETPLRFKFRDHLAGDLPFDVLVRALLRRASTLMSCYGAGSPDLDYPGLVARAGAVQTVENRLRWHDWRRFSFRQNQALKFGGLLGQISYQGDLAEFMPLVEFCAKTHLGKMTAFGLGQYAYETG